MKVYFYVVILK